MALLPFPCHAQGWQLSVVEKGVVDGVHVMSIEPPFTDDPIAYQFVLYRPCPQTEPVCAMLFVRPDAPLPTQVPIPNDYYPQVIAYEVKTQDWRNGALRCLYPSPRPSVLACLDFARMNADFHDWGTRKLFYPHPDWQEIWYISHPSKHS